MADNNITPGNRDLISPLVRNVVSTSFDKLPLEAIAACKASVLDCIAATIAGSSAPGVAETLTQLQFWGGREESTVAIFGNRLPAHNAALVNVLMGHALELDDAHYPAIVHPTTPTLWSALATAEAIGGCSGKRLIEAICSSVDLMCRLALAGPKTIDYGYHTALYSIFGATTASAKLRRLDEQKMHDALGISFAQAAATVQAGIDGALVKRLQPAFNTCNGIKAVLFAQAGITGVSKIISGDFGLYRLFNRGECNEQHLLDGLGSRFLGSELSIKRYPTSRCSHAAIEGTLSLVHKYDLKPHQIAKVVVEVQAGCFKREHRPYDPFTGTPQVAAQFSIDYAVAAALLWRVVFIEQISDKSALDPRAIELSRKVEIRMNERETGPTPYLPVNVTIQLTSGAEMAITVRQLRGSPQDPLTWDEIVVERLERCLPYSAVPIPRKNVIELIKLVENLEHVSDVRALIALLVPSND